MDKPTELPTLSDEDVEYMGEVFVNLDLLTRYGVSFDQYVAYTMGAVDYYTAWAVACSWRRLQ
jgi:hypothetical protein